MKQILLIGTFLLASVFTLHAQNYVASRYYSDQTEISDVPVGQAYYKYDYYGRAIGVFQMWKEAEWHSDSGGSYVYVWGNGGWQYQWYTGTYYWFTWVVYEKQIE